MKTTSINLEKHVHALTDEIGIRFDSMGSALGWLEFTVNAPDTLRKLIAGIFHRHGVYHVELTEPCPYTDQFPFAACSVPGMRILTVFTDRNRTGTVGL